MVPVSARLTAREEAVLELWYLQNKEIAKRLGISPRTVDAMMRSLFVKLGVTRRPDAARAAGLIE